jgi:hypothetical protein
VCYLNQDQHHFPFLDQCIKAIYDDYNLLRNSQVKTISAEF